MRKTRREFSPEFKREAAALLESSGRSQMQIAAGLGIQPSMLRSWRAIQNGMPPRPQVRQVATTGQAVASPADLASENAKLRRELERMRMERDVPQEKPSASSRRCRSEVCLHRASHAAVYPVRLMCRVLEVSPSGYYAWRSRPESPRALANRQVVSEIRRLAAQHHSRYGSPRMHATLRAEGYRCSRGRVARLMRAQGIRAVAGRRFRPCTTDSRHALAIAPALLEQRFQGSGRNWHPTFSGPRVVHRRVSA